jgi:hypothetical protein
VIGYLPIKELQTGRIGPETTAGCYTTKVAYACFERRYTKVARQGIVLPEPASPSDRVNPLTAARMNLGSLHRDPVLRPYAPDSDYLSNQNRVDIPRPPSFTYDTTFDTQNCGYKRRAQISHTLQHREADRFTVKITVARSAFHHFRATLRDITGLKLKPLPIEMNCFVPRSRWTKVESSIAQKIKQ